MMKNATEWLTMLNLLQAVDMADQGTILVTHHL